MRSIEPGWVIFFIQWVFQRGSFLIPISSVVMVPLYGSHTWVPRGACCNSGVWVLCLGVSYSLAFPAVSNSTPLQSGFIFIFYAFLWGRKPFATSTVHGLLPAILCSGGKPGPEHLLPTRFLPPITWKPSFVFSSLSSQYLWPLWSHPFILVFKTLLLWWLKYFGGGVRGACSLVLAQQTCPGGYQGLGCLCTDSVWWCPLPSWLAAQGFYSLSAVWLPAFNF